MNKVFLIANLTKDPEATTTATGIAVCKFTVAVNRNYGDEKQTDYLSIVAWRKTAENCAKFLKKGSKVGLCGSIQTRSYDAADGSKRYVTEIVADEVQFLFTSEKGDSEIANASNMKTDMNKLKPIDDDLPF